VSSLILQERIRSAFAPGDVSFYHPRWICPPHFHGQLGSYSQAHRVFRAVTGRSPSEYMGGGRVEQALCDYRSALTPWALDVVTAARNHRSRQPGEVEIGVGQGNPQIAFLGSLAYNNLRVADSTALASHNVNFVPNCRDREFIPGDACGNLLDA
jgi:hypothetical protein